MGKKAVVIGSGFGGIAISLRLKKLGFKQETNLENAIYQTINWFKNNRYKKNEKYMPFSKL